MVTKLEAPPVALVRRERDARLLADYVIGELRTGRGLEAVMHDGRVQSRIADAPWLLDDLAANQELANAA